MHLFNIIGWSCIVNSIEFWGYSVVEETNVI